MYATNTVSGYYPDRYPASGYGVLCHYGHHHHHSVEWKGESYFLLSRNLGPVVGAGVGWCLFVANSLAVAMYLGGCVEALEEVTPAECMFTPVTYTSVTWWNLCCSVH